MTGQSWIIAKTREDFATNGMARYADVEALAFAIVHALEDRDSGLIAEVRALRQEITMLCEEVSNLSHVVIQERAQAAGPSASFRDAVRADLAKLIERLNIQSRVEQVVALREEVRAQLGALNHAAELASPARTLSTAPAQSPREDATCSPG